MPISHLTLTHTVTAEADGCLLKWMRSVWAWPRGRLCRTSKHDDPEADAGIESMPSSGDQVTAGQPLFTLHTDDEWRIPGS